MTTNSATPAVPHSFFKTTRSACAVALLVSLAACGGGGGGGGGFAGFPVAGGNPPATNPPASDPPVVVTEAKFSGTAAAGLPLSGNVTVKDAKGATKTVPLVDGHYDIDVTGMTGPFVFRAEGTVGGQRTVIHSAATAADANGTINITPLTDLVVANIAGRLADQYFDSGDFAGVSPEQLKAESDALKAKLLPVLQAMGVDASIDLLRTAFTPLSSALDKALDVLRVSVDPVTNVATITNIVTQQQITDDLAVKAAQDAGTTPLSGNGLSTAADDIVAIRKVLSDFVGKFANGLPAPGELLPLLSDTTTSGYNFRFADQTAAQFTTETAADVNLVGASFTDVVIQRINYTIDADNTNPRAYVEFTHRDKNGVAFSNNQNVQIVKGTDGVWRLRGDGRVLDIDAHAHAVKDGASGCVSTGLQFSIQDVNPGNSNAAVAVVVTGPGLPPAGVRHVRPQTSGFWPIAGGDGSNYYYLASNCSGIASAGLADSAIAALPATPEYTFTAYTSGGAIAKITSSTFDIQYTQRLHGRALTLAEATAAAFPSVTTSAALSSYNGGGDFAINATGLNPGFAAEFYLSLFNGTERVEDQADVAPSSAGAASKTFGLPAVSGQLFRYMFVSTRDANWRQLVLRRQD
ncbi:hypothetical protein QTI51_12135 [Variovorax sp. J22G73]|uniref:hypothetical protein n=1 Tax=unclassified Variovorax TaxID=663243 RepID=UPI000D5D74AE|nr:MULTISPECIES: hypothetical protein [unclassified Variovorax]MDM0005949.1 hypothetical protein [Variovorax sp. J22R203]MDM0098027.1 hypothetical protein [Variovorax sp. J22G73]